VCRSKTNAATDTNNDVVAVARTPNRVQTQTRIGNTR
jgi:hypothetical protein